MGNYCCPPKNESSANSEQAVYIDMQAETQYFINEVKVSSKVGDILTETADAIVVGVDNFVRNRSGSFLTQNMMDQLNAEFKATNKEENIVQPNGTFSMSNQSKVFKNVKCVFHLSIPLWRGGKKNELEQLQEGFEKILIYAKQNNINSIIFTDVFSNLFGIPKQLSAEKLVDAIKYYNKKSPSKMGENQKKVEINQQNQEGSSGNTLNVKFIHKDSMTVQLFQDTVKKDLGIREDRAESKYCDVLKDFSIATDDNSQNESL